MSGTLAILKIIMRTIANSASVVPDGVESEGDVFASGFVLVDLQIAGLPADRKHPYGHGRYETLTGFIVGDILFRETSSKRTAPTLRDRTEDHPEVARGLVKSFACILSISETEST